MSSTVGILGLGGLGGVVSQYLAAAGTGTLILVDDQVPELSNLNRQVLHWESDVRDAVPKVESAARKLRELNSETRVVTRKERVTRENIDDIFSPADVIIDCLDDFNVRYILNEYCVRNKRPFIHGGIDSFHGQLTTIIPYKTPCLNCIFPNVPQPREMLPVIGVTASFFGSLQAAEAIKLLTGIGEPLTGKLLVGDLRYNQYEKVYVRRVENCPVCGVKGRAP
jgi:molybdopterin/thiamine biosynthesis adenylyltransferase